jgi:hypothetical protein
MTHWPPLEGTKQATTVEISAVKNGRVCRVDTVASSPPIVPPSVVNWSRPATPP